LDASRRGTAEAAGGIADGHGNGSGNILREFRGYREHGAFIDR
jgi:hypothetical protein